MATAVIWLHQFVCGLQGHDSLMQFERGRLSLKCVSCGHESPGWDLRRSKAADAMASAEAAPKPRRILPHLASARRIVLGS